MGQILERGREEAGAKGRRVWSRDSKNWGPESGGDLTSRSKVAPSWGMSINGLPEKG